MTPLFTFIRNLRLVSNSNKIKGGNGPFRIIHLDDPWQFANWTTNEQTKYDTSWARRNGRAPYVVMKQEDLFDIPVWELASRDSVCLMWATWPKMIDALELMHFRGFEFKTVAFVWIKQNPSTIGWHFGMGYYTHGNTEFVLLGRRGKGVKRANKDVSQLIFYPRGAHSAKPPIVRDRIVRLFGDVPRCELFARTTCPGWSSWGNEVPEDEIFASINDFMAPPIEAVIDEDEAAGLAVIDTEMIYQLNDQIRMLM